MVDYYLVVNGLCVVNLDGRMFAPNDQLNANTFLAKNRGIGMRDSLVKDLNSMGLKISTNNIQLLGREDGKWVADSKEPSEQYVNVIIDGLTGDNNHNT